METTIEYPEYYKKMAYFNSGTAANYLAMAEMYHNEVDMYKWAHEAVQRANIYWQAYVNWDLAWNKGAPLTYKREVMLKLRELDNS